MAEAGFPWHAQNQPRVSSILSEKDDELAHSVGNTERVVSISEGHKPRSDSIRSKDAKPRTNGSISKATGAHRASNASRQNLRFAPEPPRSREPINPVNRIPVRTIPPWIQDADEDELIEAGLLPENPETALVAQHNHSPANIHRPSLGANAPKPREGFPLSSGARRDEPTSRWVSFARTSAYPRENFHSEKVSAEWLNENFTDYSKPWLADHADGDAEDGSDRYRAFRRKRRVWYKRVHFAIMRNPFVPLAFRFIVILFAAVGMGLGANIFHQNNVINACINQPEGQRTAKCAKIVGQGEVIYNEDPSALMAIIVDAVAIVYSIYITYDEYFSKPLGLRPAAAKVRLVLLDLFFIVFQSANLSLAFNSLANPQGPCKKGVEKGTSLVFNSVCDSAESLSSVLLVSLVAWLFTFSVSILRLVERMR